MHFSLNTMFSSVINLLRNARDLANRRNRRECVFSSIFLCALCSVLVKDDDTDGFGAVYPLRIITLVDAEYVTMFTFKQHKILYVSSFETQNLLYGR